MTSEIIIMNKEAIALAADSAVTIAFPKKDRQKVYTSANKIFALSKYQPVGIMIYGNTSFMGVPWDIITKVYREKLGDKKFDTLKEYADDFIDFLKKDERLSSDSEQEKYVSQRIYGYFYLEIRQEILQELEEVIHEKEIITEEKTEEITSEIINKHYDIWKNSEILPSIPKDHIKALKDKYESIFDEAKENIFEKLPLSETLSSKLTEIGVSLFVKSPRIPPDISGVVVAGFGEKSLFPSFQSLFIDGIANNVLKYWEEIYGEITFDIAAFIKRFAQSEMVSTFIEGVMPDYQNEIERYLRELINNYPDVIIDSIEKLSSDEKKALKQKLKDLSGKALDKYIEELNNYRRENYVDPVIDAVAMLPKEELASMAESLVKLTSFKKRVTGEEETVAEPIDVALISKGDGFIWIKRKHYFKPELNPQFFVNYNRRCRNEYEE